MKRSKVLAFLTISVAFLPMLWAASDEGIQGSSVRAAQSSILYHKFRPSVIYADGEDSTTLEVATTGFDIAGVYIKKAGSWVQMYDDGSYGDNVAGDGIYTFDNFTKYLPSDFDMGFEGDHMIWGPEVKIVKVGGAEETNWLSLGLVSSDQRISSIEYGNGLFASEYAFFIVDSAREIFPNMPLATIYCGKNFPVAYQKFYSVFPDIFDFIILMPNGPIFNSDNYRENVPYFNIAKNEVQNIGVPIFDNTSSFYSAGRLRGFTYHSWGYGSILDHEIGHAWGVRLGYSLGLVEGAHWVAEADINGQMNLNVFTDGIFGHLVDNGDGTWRVEPENPGTFHYPPLELYVMGLIPPEDVPPVHILVNPDYSDPQQITAEDVITITIDQLMAAEGGERIPLYPNAQTSFNAAFIIVSDEPFSNAEIAYYSLVSMYFSSQMEGEYSLTPFYTGTGGLASLSAKILPAISGAVKTAGEEGIEEVTITFSNGGGVVMTDSSGNYSHGVSYGWAGTATPSKADYTFSPSSRNYTYVTSDQQNQDYAGTPSQCTLTISAGTGGTTYPVPENYTYDTGTEVTITAIQNSGYEFSGWSGDASGTTNPITITMDSDKSIKANFTAISTGDGDGDTGGGGGCFIATATYGSSFHPFVGNLRDFRDKYLIPNKLGRTLVNLYYKYSPFVAEFITKHKALRTVVRINLLPLVAFSYSLLHFGLAITAVWVLFIFVLPIFLISFFRRRLSRLEARDPNALASLD